MPQFEFYLPMTHGEWIAFVAACATIAIGVLALLFPRLALTVLGLGRTPGRSEGGATGRATVAGFLIGVGAMAVMLAQPLVYMALGAGWLATAAGRIASVALDRGFTVRNALLLVAEAILAAAPLAYGLGYL